MTERGRLTRIFLGACALPPGERAAYLDASCAGDAELRSEVEAMLAADASAQGGRGTADLAAPFARAASEVIEASPPLPGRIGPYRILEILGEGGMGIVYRAAQEEPVRRDVALKLVRGVIDSAAAVSRFEVERQSLALLSHPNVARLYAAGTTEDGRPYFVMELVRGEPITEYCATHALSLKERVKLFASVCRGVRHAHQRGVIHRDLKPSNILIAKAETQVVPKVIDFSIAKALGAPGLGTEFRTRTGQVIGTLEYMSPEQAAGRIERIDTRSDVYSLGVVLYELIAGRRPHDVEGQPLHEAVRRIVEEPPAPLRGAGRTSPGRTDEDLVTIVAKCLEKEPDRRYGSAADLVEDLERYLDSKPISARPPSTMYQMRKLVGRHRAIFGSMALALVLLLAFSITVTIELGVQRRERQRADEEARKALRINTFLQDMLAAADPARQGGKVSIRQVLDQAAARMDAELKDEPEIAAELHRTLGQTYRSLGVPERMKEHFAKSLDLRIRLYGEDDPETAKARLDLARELFGRGNPVKGEAEARRALATFHSHEPAGSIDEATALQVLADEEYELQKLDLSRSHAEQALEMLGALTDAPPALKASTLNTLGTTLVDMGLLKEGEARLRESAAIDLAELGEHSVQRLDVLSDLAYCLWRQERFDESIAVNREVLAGRRKLLGSDHAMVAVSENNLAVALLDSGRCPEAEVLLEDVHRIGQLNHGGVATSVARDWLNLGAARQCEGNYEGAFEAYQTAWRILKPHVDQAPGVATNLLLSLGSVDDRLGRLKEGETYLRRGLDTQEAHLGKESIDRTFSLYHLGNLLIDEGRPRDAEADLREAMKSQTPTVNEKEGRPRENPLYFLELNALGRALDAGGKVEEAAGPLDQARSSLLSGTQYVDLRRNELKRTAGLYERLHRPDDAKPYRDALNRLEARARSTGEPAPR